LQVEIVDEEKRKREGDEEEENSSRPHPKKKRLDLAQVDISSVSELWDFSTDPDPTLISYVTISACCKIM
jgi:hypothetical protein